MSIATSSLEGWRVFGEPILEVLEFSFSTVVDTSFVVLWVENESWISSDLDSIGLIGGSIKLGDDKVGLIFVMLTELIPDWCKFLAMSAPWGIVLNEDIFGWVLNNIVKL